MCFFTIFLLSTWHTLDSSNEGLNMTGTRRWHLDPCQTHSGLMRNVPTWLCCISGCRFWFQTVSGDNMSFSIFGAQRSCQAMLRDRHLPPTMCSWKWASRVQTSASYYANLNSSPFHSLCSQPLIPLTGTEWHWGQPLLHRQYSTRLLLSIGRNHDWYCQ